VTLAREALARRGVRDASSHIVVVKKDHPLGDNGLVMVKKRPFTAEELATVREVCASRDFELIALPGEQLDNAFTDYLAEQAPARFYASYPFDVRPPTDDWPFFFNTAKAESLFASLRLRGAMDAMRTYNFDAVFILFILLAFAVVSLLLVIFIPLARHARGAQGRASRLPAAKLFYFVCLGLGFILLEVVLIQRFHLYLGHPVYSLAVILVSVLALSGIGSVFTQRVSDARVSRAALVASAAVLVFLAAHEACWASFLRWTLGMSLPTRIAMAVASLIPIGLCMGMPYPLGLRAISRTNPGGLPWVWAVNAAASVVGSIAAFALAMAVGFRAVLLISGFCYLGALASSLALRSSRQTEGDEQEGGQDGYASHEKWPDATDAESDDLQLEATAAG
jgi:hypothetical protein